MKSDLRRVLRPGNRLDLLATTLPREAPEAPIQRASKTLSSSILPNRDDVQVRKPALGQEEPEQVRHHFTLLVSDHQRAVTELVNEHRVMQLNRIALAPERRQAPNNRVEVRLACRLCLHETMLAYRLQPVGFREWLCILSPRAS
jgi:hypothetical protein